MNNVNFNEVLEGQLTFCKTTLNSKAKEYADDEDRLQHFKKAGALMGVTPEEALLGMMTKHIVSIADMCRTGEHPLDMWFEKITDAMNYLILLRALVEEKKGAKHE
jgi:hypothetical protein